MGKAKKVSPWITGLLLVALLLTLLDVSLIEGGVHYFYFCQHTNNVISFNVDETRGGCVASELESSADIAVFDRCLIPVDGHSGHGREQDD